MVERLNTKKTRIAEVSGGKFFPSSKEGMKPSLVITNFGEKLTRVSVVATVTEKFIGENENYASITIDDGSDAIRAKTFREDIKVFQNISVGDRVLVIGKIRIYNNELYINPDFVKKVTDPNVETYWKIEVLRNLYSRKKIIDEIKRLRDEMSEEELEEYAREKFGIDAENLKTILSTTKMELDFKPKILEIIEKLDAGEGVEIGKLLEFSNIEQNIIESAISELLAAGMIYEPVVGKLKKI